VFEIERRRLFKAGEPVHLTEAESELLFQLARRAGEPVSREALSPQGEEAGDSRLTDVQMTRLRRKVEDDPRFPRYLVTVRGRGYMLQPD
jgi:two-component system phosphate regulon response regulator OmpR